MWFNLMKSLLLAPFIIRIVLFNFFTLLCISATGPVIQGGAACLAANTIGSKTDIWSKHISVSKFSCGPHITLQTMFVSDPLTWL